MRIDKETAVAALQTAFRFSDGNSALYSLASTRRVQSEGHREKIVGVLRTLLGQTYSASQAKALGLLWMVVARATENVELAGETDINPLKRGRSPLRPGATHDR